MGTPREIVLPQRLEALVMYCEKTCVAGCCGIGAFDFSPLHVASFLSANTGEISEESIEEWELELRKAEVLAWRSLPDEHGFICSVAGMNQYFRRADFDAFIAELRHSIQVAPRVVEFCDQLRRGL